MPDVRLTWLPPLTPERLAVCALAAVAAAFLLRAYFGGPSPAARSKTLFVLRCLTLAALAAVLLNPVRVETTPGEVDRPEVAFLFDASESMKLGHPESRWAAVGGFLDGAAPALRDSPARVVPYAFGRRLRVAADGAASADAAGLHSSLAPVESDTRLDVALRQLTSRIGREPPAGVVLFSDGRTRDPAAAEAAAAAFAGLKVPVHVVPVGSGAGGGDVAVVGAAVPERVRKYSENEVTVFLRSFGFDGRRAEVRLAAAGDDGPERVLASAPVTLTGGVQSVTVPFRSETRPARLRVSVPPRDGEVTPTNNAFEADVEIDRTKIRVLYVEGSDQPLRYVPRDAGYDVRGPHSPLQDALAEDPDVECVAFATGGLGALRLIDRSSGGTVSLRGFPETAAELFAFDAIILSNVSRGLFTDEQLVRIERWIGRRGGGLCVVGGSNAFGPEWSGTPVADMLPILSPEPGSWDGSPLALRPAERATGHPLWRLTADAAQNGGLIDAMPPVVGPSRPLVPKPDVGETVGVASGSGGPAVVSGRYGRGRTLVVAPAVAAPPGADPLIDAWGEKQGALFGKLWRNAVYWLTENSSTGRRRLTAETDKRFYQPEETVSMRAVAFDEAADATASYRVVAMIEPRSLDFDFESLDSPLLWPEGRPRTSGEDGPYVTWGEEIELRPDADGRYGLDLKVAAKDDGADLPPVRVELTAYEGVTQVDSTSVDVQIVDDPFERRDPFPDHDLLRRIASTSGGRVFASPGDLAAWMSGLPTRVGPDTVRREPVWDRWPVLLALLGMVTAEWFWRRKAGLA